jgi:nitroreductase
MQKTAVTAAAIAPVLADRWSPRAYDETYEVSQHELLSILEAGRWAPSANNGQPWRYSVAKRGTELFDQMIGAMTGFNQAWAPRASAIIVISILKQKPDGSAYEVAMLDAGLTAQNMMIQTTELGLAAHPIGGMVHAQMAEVLELSDELRPVLALTIGKRADASTLEGTPAFEREVAARVRHDLDDIVLHGKP